MISRKNSSIKSRIIVSFCGFSLCTSMLFSFYNILFVYTVEDTFFEQLLQDEAHYLITSNQLNKKTITPRQHFMQVYFKQQELPENVQQALTASPTQREFSGNEGKHYHLFVSEDPSFFLLAEVSDYLVVRPRRHIILSLLSISAVIMLVFTALGGYWLATRTTRPLNALVKLVEDAQPETLPVKFAHSFPRNEIGILASALETAMARIKGFVQREQHFTRDVSHELRTPIAIIQGACELLQRENSHEGSLALVQRISQASFEMEQVTDTLLTLARESTQLEAQGRVNLLPLIEQSVIKFSYLLEKKYVQVAVSVPGSFKVATNKNALNIILDNLIRNAFMYTVEGVVKVSIENHELVITNTGIGIDTSIQPSICEPMVKGQNSTGFGLGLSIVKRLCEVYRLKFSIENTDSGIQANIKF